MPSPFQSLCRAIRDDECATVEALLRRDPGLAQCGVEEDERYETGMAHWIYSGDTALHVAAALGLGIGAQEHCCGIVLVQLRTVSRTGMGEDQPEHARMGDGEAHIGAARSGEARIAAAKVSGS